MALLSQCIRTVAITGRTDTVNTWFAGRQGGRWAEQTLRGAFPEAAARSDRVWGVVETGPPRDPAAALQELQVLRERGVVTEAEFDRLRKRLGV